MKHDYLIEGTFVSIISIGCALSSCANQQEIKKPNIIYI